MIALVALSAYFIAQASKNYQDDPSPGNFIQLGLSMIPGEGLTSAAGSDAKEVIQAIKPREINIGKKLRISPLGNWTAKTRAGGPRWAARLPHYHFEGAKDPSNIARTAMKWHRPWETAIPKLVNTVKSIFNTIRSWF